MSYEPHTWEVGDVITAERLNALEQAVANMSSYDAELKFYHDNNSSHDWVATIVSGTYSDLMAIIDDNITPNMLIRVWNEASYTYTSSNIVAIYVVDDSLGHIVFQTKIPTTNLDGSAVQFYGMTFNWHSDDTISL